MHIRVPRLDNREFFRTLFIGYFFITFAGLAFGCIQALSGQPQHIRVLGVTYTGIRPMLLALLCSPLEAAALALSTTITINIGLWMARGIFLQ